MIQIENMHFAYKRKHSLYKGLNLQLHKGSIIGLFGRNGEGKSTLMKLITGQLVAQSGRVLSLGIDAGKRKLELLQQVYMLPEEMPVPRITVREYFGIVAPFYPTYDEAMASEILREFEVDWSWNLAQISLGQRKKAMIALALALRTPILLLDEPTNGLDIPSKSIFRRLLAKYSQPEQIVIISTHQVRDLEQVIDHIVIIRNNQVACNESLQALSSAFAFGQVTAENKGEALYSEPSVIGEYGMWERSTRDEEAEDFSIEIFFNAITCYPTEVQQALQRAKHTEQYQSSEAPSTLSLDSEA